MKEFKLTLRRDKETDGQAPIHFRHFIKGKPIYIASGITLAIQHWNEEEAIVSKKWANSKRINNELNAKLDTLNTNLREVLRRHPNASRKAIRSLLVSSRASHKFFHIADEYLTEILEDKEIGTYDDRKSKINKFKNFCKNDELTIEDITDELLYKYKRHLKVVVENSGSTINANIKCIRAVFNFAIDRYKIQIPFNPFFKFKFEKEQSKRVFLTESELEKFANVHLNPSTKLAIYQDMFLFSAKGFGIRVSDMLFLKWNDFNGTHFDYQIFKTDKQAVVKASKALLAILKKYQTPTSRPDDFIFPILNPNLDYNDPKTLDVAISRATACYNKGLKAITKKAGITKRISSHVARHTFATIARSKGMDVFDLRDFLKHSNVRETQIYAGTIDPKLDKLVDTFCLN